MGWLEPARLEGRHVVLEPLAREHLDELRIAAADETIFSHLTVSLGTPEAMARWYDQAREAALRDEALAFATRRRADGRLVGSTRYMNAVPAHRRVEIGWTWLMREAWGGPLNVETKILLLGHAFERLGAHRVEFRTDILNVRSQAAIAALGATKDGEFRRHMIVRGGRVRDTVQYAIVDEDWPAIRLGLEARLTEKAARAPA